MRFSTECLVGKNEFEPNKRNKNLFAVLVTFSNCFPIDSACLSAQVSRHIHKTDLYYALKLLFKFVQFLYHQDNVKSRFLSKILLCIQMTD